MEIQELMTRYLNGACNKQEIDILFDHFAEADSEDQLRAFIVQAMKHDYDFSEIDQEIAEVSAAAYDTIMAYAGTHATKKNRFHLFLKIAALVVVLFSVSFLLYNTMSSDVGSKRIVASVDASFDNDVLPAMTGARIVREDGKVVELDDNVQLFNDGSIISTNNKLIVGANRSVMNTLIVPAANFLNITLSDGTKVWINASSELQFPSTFASNERKVSLIGEAYFEVAKDASRPFIVESRGTRINVLGTHFNVNAYTNRMSTTLLEGKIEVSNALSKEILEPGQKVQADELSLKVGKADIVKDLAWKNNIFYFKGDNIIQIAKQLETWYDLEIGFSKEVSLSQTYSGEISRQSNLTEVLRMLEFVSDLEFNINNNKLLIRKSKKV